MQQFIHQKKKKNQSKYGDHSKVNEVALPVPKGTISIMMNTRKKNSLFKVTEGLQNIHEKSKFKIKWKTIQWLWTNRKVGVCNVKKKGKYIFTKCCGHRNFDSYVSEITVDLGFEQF